MFDNRLGSELFAASITDATINTSIGGELTDSAISNETKEKIKSSMCIIKYTPASWKIINDTLRKDNERLRNALVQILRIILTKILIGFQKLVPSIYYL